MGDADAVLQRLARPLQPDDLQVVQRGHAGVVGEQAQQVARAMRAVMPALEASGPSTTNTRLSTTCACGGANARSACSNSWRFIQPRLETWKPDSATRRGADGR